MRQTARSRFALPGASRLRRPVRRLRPRPDMNPRPPAALSVACVRGARTVVAVTSAAAVFSVLLVVAAAWGVPHSWLQAPNELFYALNLPGGDNAAAAAIMLAMSWALARRKRLGWWALFLMQAVGVAVSAFIVFLGQVLVPGDGSGLLLFTPLDIAVLVVSITFGLVSLPALWHLRPAFPGRLRQASWASVAGTALVGLFATSVVVTVVVLVGAEDRMQTPFIVVAVLNEAVQQSPLLTPVPAKFVWVEDVAVVGLIATLLATVYVFLSSAQATNPWTPQRELAVRKLLSEHGEDSLGYFATRSDKSVVFGISERSAVSYAVVGSVSLASGDPLGDRRFWGEAIAAWQAEARFYGWSPAVLAASEDGAQAYAAAGLKVLDVGDEAVLNVDRFTTGNTSRTSLRRTVNRLRRTGHTVKIRRWAELSAEEAAAIGVAASQWRHGEAERGFSMALSRQPDTADRKLVVVTAYDSAGALVGLLTFAPWGRHGGSLDVMQRSQESPGGVTDLMIVSFMEQAATLGWRQVSMNFCVFRRVFTANARVAPLPGTRIIAGLLTALDRWFQVESLYRFSARFGPEWVPRYLCFDSNLSLASTAVAVARAEGFLPQPFSMRRGAAARTGLTAAQMAELAAHEAKLLPSAEGLAPRRNQQMRHRIQCVTDAAAAGESLFPVGAFPAQPLGAVVPGVKGQQVCVAARVRRLRRHGLVVFADVVDGAHTAQLLVAAEGVGPESTRRFSKQVAVGDVVVVTGVWGVSRTGTRSLLATQWQVVAKALLPIPFEGLTDPGRRMRERSLDLMVNPAGADLLRQRSAAVAAVRDVLRAKGFLEVETPMLNTVHGGASARPFHTHINAYNRDLTLRIAPELYLKRLVVAGMGPVFEIGRNFRNEGVDATHNPEFTAVEAYQPFSDYHGMRELMQELVQQAAVAVHGSQVAMLPLCPGGGLEEVDISGTWPVVPVLEAVSAAVGREVSLETEFEVLLGLCRRHEVHVRDDMGPGALIEELYGELVEPATVRPTFFVDFPEETSPLAGPHRSKPGLAERWDMVVAGTELGTAYSELTDPLVQRERLTRQSLKAAAGDLEAMAIDEAFLAALELGMPPCGGLGMGMDRLVMLLTGTTIRQVLTFPFVKP